MLGYSPEPAQIIGQFFAYRNQILVYTEDVQKDKEFYVCLFNRLVGDSIVIRDVIPLGSRKDVVDACKRAGVELIPEVYIIDSDIDLINGGVEESHENLYPLPVYCCENLLFDEGSIVDLAYLDCGKKNKNEISENLRFSERVVNEFSLIHDLFLHFAICRKIESPFSLRGYDEFVLESKCAILDINKIKFELDSLVDLIIVKKGKLFYDSQILTLRETWPLTLDTISKIVSGKDYLVPYLRRLCSELSGKKSYHSKESLKLRLVLSCDLGKLEGLKELMVAKVEGNRAS